MPKSAESGFDSHALRHFHNNMDQESQRGTMKIRIIENQILHRRGPNGEVIHHPLRSWDIDFDAVSLKEVWLGIKGDCLELINLAKNSIR